MHGTWACSGCKHTLRNVLDAGEFTCSFANWDLHEAMNLSSAAVQAGIDEYRGEIEDPIRGGSPSP